ncbi:hypothetical protein G7081_07120 [Vagococcus coleopterorum]|uniref:Uncharacterized protein n=1 Tax=Vagococcus coleopterorum TaxID=2714946 RepID=A0A6G8APE3_9ENTE|nr:hypothetical protein [Vagococcus coleopterorum]QIL46857.1 hypothetical protein G7081_07120 [Vagococcus coleopterorum]
MKKILTLSITSLFKLFFVFISFMIFLNVVMGLDTGFFDHSLTTQIWAVASIVSMLWLLALVMMPISYTYNHLKVLAIISAFMALVVIMTSFDISTYTMYAFSILLAVLIYFLFIHFMTKK